MIMVVKINLSILWSPLKNRTPNFTIANFGHHISKTTKSSKVTYLNWKLGCCGGPAEKLKLCCGGAAAEKLNPVCGAAAAEKL